MNKRLTGVHFAVFTGFTAVGLMLSIMYIWRISFLGWVMFDRTYYYGLFAAFLPPAFMYYPMRKASPRDRVPWYDYSLAALSVGIFSYFAFEGLTINQAAWAYLAPNYATAMSLAGIILIMEGTRRSVGLLFTAIASVFFFFPMFTQYMPSLLKGVSTTDFWALVRINALGSDSICGIPIRVVGEVIIGYLVFGVVMVKTGAGSFFINIATSILGRARGGPAKVGCLSSGLFGMLSGSVVANVVTVGSFTIPAMKRIGLPPHMAGAVEACASTGGVLMPPVMGTTAFVMAGMLGVPYSQVALAAFIPAFMYYFGLFVGIDCFAAKAGIKGMPREQCPKALPVLKAGWLYLLALGLLVYLLFFIKWEAWAPFYVSIVLIALASIRKSTRLNARGFLETLKEIGVTICMLAPSMGSVGIIIAAFTMTGVGHAFSREVLALAGGSVPFIILLGALTSFILGMGMTITACYIFLVLTMAPALTQAGLNLMAVHLFSLYYGMLSYITPPVAFGAYTAATLAGADMMKTGYTAMKLGAVLFVIPFGFILSPALVLQDSAWWVIILHTVSAFVGSWVVACGLGGYITWAGPAGWLTRVLLTAGGVMLLIPGMSWSWVGAPLVATAVAWHMVRQRWSWHKASVRT